MNQMFKTVVCNLAVVLLGFFPVMVCFAATDDAADKTTNPPKPNTFVEGSSQVSGSGEPGATIYVVLPDNSIESSRVGQNGEWMIAFSDMSIWEEEGNFIVFQKSQTKGYSSPLYLTVVPGASVVPRVLIWILFTVLAFSFFISVVGHLLRKRKERTQQIRFIKPSVADS